MAARQLYVNRAAASGTVLTASSEATGVPRRRVLDQARGLRWRSKVGWNVVAGRNDTVNFIRASGVQAATITAGNYATRALYAAAVQATMQATDPGGGWTVVWDSDFNVFRFSTAATSFTLLFGTGPQKAQSAAIDLGFAETDVTDSGAPFYVRYGATVAYKSREWLTVDLGSAQAVKACVVMDHNLAGAGSMWVQGHTVDTAAGWASPDVNQALNGDVTLTRRSQFFASASKRYWRLLINDVATNTAGFTELSLWWVGAYDDPTISYSVDYQKVPDQLSTVAQAIGGAHVYDERAQQWVHSVSWLEVPEADRDKLLAWIAAAPRGKNTFLILDPTNAPTVMLYGFFDGAPQVRMSSNLYWTVSVTFREALP